MKLRKKVRKLQRQVDNLWKAVNDLTIEKVRNRVAISGTPWHAKDDFWARMSQVPPGAGWGRAVIDDLEDCVARDTHRDFTSEPEAPRPPLAVPEPAPAGGRAAAIERAAQKMKDAALHGFALTGIDRDQAELELFEALTLLPEPPAPAPAWQDRPDRTGWWWRHAPGGKNPLEPIWVSNPYWPEWVVEGVTYSAIPFPELPA